MPLTLHMEDLNSDWKRMTIATVGSGGGLGDLMSQIMPMAMMSSLGGPGGGKGKDEAMGMAMMSSMFGGGGGSQPVYYTKGQTTPIGGETFLIAYRYTVRAGRRLRRGLPPPWSRGPSDHARHRR